MTILTDAVQSGRTITTLTVSETRDILAVYIGNSFTRETVRNWIDSGEFPNARKLRTGRPLSTSKWIIPIGDVAAFVQRHYPNGPLPAVLDKQTPEVIAFLQVLSGETQTPVAA